MDDELNQTVDKLLTLTPDEEINFRHHVARLRRVADALLALARRPIFLVEQATMILTEVDELAEDITLLCAALHGEPQSTILPATADELRDDGGH